MVRFLPIILLLAACGAAAPPQRPLPEAGADTCRAARFAALVGQSDRALQKMLILEPVRVIRPGDAVTMDYLAQRLNFRIGGDGRIVAITCG